MSDSGSERDAAAWADIARNLDTESRRLDELEGDVDRLLAGEDVEFAAGPRAVSTPIDYDAITRINDEWRTQHGNPDVELWNVLGEKQRGEWEAWRGNARLGWGFDDFLAVGLAGVIGALAALFDDQVDQAVLGGLSKLRDTDLLRGWETAAKRMPIDYTGPKFGGPGHRVRSAGHDPARVFSALNQIRNGQFRGIIWEDGVRTTFATPVGSYVPVEALSEALLLWAKHLAADFVTPMSLPLPGWTFLAHPNRGCRSWGLKPPDSRRHLAM